MGMGNPEPGCSLGVARPSAPRPKAVHAWRPQALDAGRPAQTDLALEERRGGSQVEEMQDIHWNRRDCGPGREPQTHLPAGRRGLGGGWADWDKMAQPHAAGGATPAGARRAVRVCFRTSGVGNGPRARARERVGGAASPEVRPRGGDLGPPAP